MNKPVKAVICIGSNQDGGREKIIAALYDYIARSNNVLMSTCVYKVSEPYDNLVAEIETTEDYDKLVESTKNIERVMGRTSDMKASGIVPVDIDIVVYDGVVKREKDYASDYFRHGAHKLGLII